MRLSLGFFAAAAMAGVASIIGHTDRWLGLHLFLAGGAVLAISAVSVMLTVTWSAAPAPPDRWVVAQRSLVAVGAVGVAAGRAAELPEIVVGISALLYVAGLVTLAALLVSTVRLGPKRRFDAAVTAYVAAICAGITGAALGMTMALGDVSASLRGAHTTINLLGLIGLTIGGTLPYFASTVGRSKMNPRTTDRRLLATLAWQCTMVMVAATGSAVDERFLAAAGLAGYAVGLFGVVMWMPSITRRQFEWAGPRLLALWAGCGWWVVAVSATAIGIGSGEPAFADRWVLVLVIAGYGQVMWGSLAYLLPMLRGGGHELLGRGFSTTRSWLGLIAANIAGLAMAVSAMPVASVAVAIWVIDAAARASKVGTTKADRPDEE